MTTGKPVTPDLRKTIEDARKRVAARDAVKKAADASDPARLVSAYRPELVDDWADADLVRARAARRRTGRRARQTPGRHRDPGDGKALIKLWDESASQLAGVGEAKAYGATAENWRARGQAAEDFLRAFNRSPQSERDLAEAWHAVTAAGPLHPSLNDAHRKRAEDAVRWAPTLEKLRRIPNIPVYDNDTKLVSAWGTGGALNGCKVAAEFATRVSDAGERLALVKALEEAIKRADAGGPEDAVVAAASKLSGSYAHPYATRVGEARKALKLLADVQKAARPGVSVGPQGGRGVRPAQGEEPEARQAARQGEPDAPRRGRAVRRPAQAPRRVRQDRRGGVAGRQAGREVAGAVGEVREGTGRSPGPRGTARPAHTRSQPTGGVGQAPRFARRPRHLRAPAAVHRVLRATGRLSAAGRAQRRDPGTSWRRPIG